MVSVTTTCRDIDELAPLARKAIILFFYECYKQGVNIFVTETYRSQDRQNYLHTLGRSRPGNIVTWTKSSRHTSRMAWDIGASQLNGNTNIYNTSIIMKAGAIARKLGITWGGDWKNNLDYPHFEINSSWKVPAGYDMSNTLVSIPTGSKGAIVLRNAVNKLPQVKLEEEDKEEKLVSTQTKLRDAGNPTLRTSAAKFVKKAFAAGLITSEQHVKDAESGDMTVEQFVLIQAHVTLEGGFLGLSESNTLKAEYVATLEDAVKDGIITNKDWIVKAKSGRLSQIDALLLNNTIERRRKAKK